MEVHKKCRNTEFEEILQFVDFVDILDFVDCEVNLIPGTFYKMTNQQIVKVAYMRQSTA